jgi:hypothetical protein
MISGVEEKLQFNPGPTPSGFMLRILEPLYAVGKRRRGKAERLRFLYRKRQRLLEANHYLFADLPLSQVHVRVDVE